MRVVLGCGLILVSGEWLPNKGRKIAAVLMKFGLDGQITDVTRWLIGFQGYFVLLLFCPRRYPAYGQGDDVACGGGRGESASISSSEL